MPLVDRTGARALAAIIGMVAVVGLTWGLTGPLLNLMLERQGVSSTLIGLNAAMTGLGALVITPFVPRLVARWGAMRLVYLSLGGTIVALLTLKAIDSFSAWFAIRFILGMAIVILFVVSEVWINQIADDTNRGRLLGIYAACISLGFGCGPLILRLTGTVDWTPFIVAAVMILLAALVISGAGEKRPVFSHERHTPFITYLRASPIALFGGIVFGAVETGVFGLMPVFGVKNGLTPELGASLLAAVALGNFVLQYPIGLLADRMRPFYVLMGCAAIGVVGGMALPFAIDTLFIWPLLFIWGGSITGIYTVSLTLLGHQYKGLALAGANAALIAAYNIGALSGQPFLGQSMDLIEPAGFGYGLALIFFGFFAFASVMAVRRMNRAT